jgi:hypothetical protein
VVGLQCGGSDAFSGVTANPAVGFAADLIVRAGGTVRIDVPDRPGLGLSPGEHLRQWTKEAVTIE